MTDKELYVKIRVIKRFIKNYEKRKIIDKELLDILRSLVVDYESEYITKIKKGGE